MWMLSFVPDSVLHLAIAAIIAAGASLYIAAFFFRLVLWLAPFREPARVIGTVLIVVGVYFYGGYSTEMSWRQRAEELQQKLARAEGLTNDEAKKLSAEGKAVVWIDGGLHATEVVGIHQWIETLYQIITRNDDETKNILKNTIILFVHANPDGQELVSNWYMRNADTLKRSTSQVPVLYQKYIGHDNNRDFFMLNMSESKNISRQQYIEWMPQILYNHHQTGPPGTVVAGPPYRDPFNYVYVPLLVTGIDALGAAMSSRLNAESKPGYTMKSGSVYSTWWNGGLRTTAYYHNIIGLFFFFQFFINDRSLTYLKTL